MTKYHRPGGGTLTNRNVFLTVWRLRSPRSRRRVSFRGLPSRRAHLAASRHAGRGSSSSKDTSPRVQSPFLWPHRNLTTAQRPHLQTPLLWGLGRQHVNLGRHRLTVPICSFVREGTSETSGLSARHVRLHLAFIHRPKTLR